MSRNPGEMFGKSLERMEALERKLRRAFHAWEREAARLRQLGRKLDRAQADQDAMDAARVGRRA